MKEIPKSVGTATFSPELCPKCGCRPRELIMTTRVRVPLELFRDEYLVVSRGIRVHSVPAHVLLKCYGHCPPWEATVTYGTGDVEYEERS